MSNNEVYIVDGARTPFLKFQGKPNHFTAAEHGVRAAQGLFTRLALEPTIVDELVVGCVGPAADEANIARIIGLRLGCGDKVPAYTVQRNCASSIQSLDSAFKDIQLGRHDVVLAGGTEAMSHAPILYNNHMVKWLSQFQSSRNLPAKLATLIKFRPKFLAPVIALLKGLNDPVVGLSMGQTAEELAFRFNITREEMDSFALRSHQRVTYAAEKNYLSEIVPIYDNQGKFTDHDTGHRPDTSLAKLAKLKPYFDKKFGMVTPGNSSQVTDGAAMLLLASEAGIKKYKLPVLGRIVDVSWAALDPKVMGLGPVYSATPLMQKHGLTMDNIDFWEINEAFAAQVLACIKAWQDQEFCQKELGLESALGELNQDILNVDGGAIALGHPVGSTGARIVLHLLKILERNKAKRGIATLCIGGGQGGALLVERE